MNMFSLPTTRFALFAALALAFALTGCFGGGDADPYSRRYTAADINGNPRLLDGTIVKGSDLSGLRLENMQVKNATFFNTTAKSTVFKNVTFDNCRFINAKFEGARLENVVFQGGIITCENDANNIQRRTAFSGSTFVNLVIDGTHLENALFDGTGGSITLNNVKNILAASPLITGRNMRISVRNSLFQNMVVAEVTGTSSLTAEHCTFYYANFGKSTFSNTAFFKNVTYGGPFYQAKERTTQRRAR